MKKGSYPFYNGTPPHVKDCDTSLAAAKRAEPKAATLRAKVKEHIKAMGEFGATDEEITDHFNACRSSIGPRRRELVLEGSVRDSGQRRKGKYKNCAIVWILDNSLPELKDKKKTARQTIESLTLENKILRNIIAQLEEDLELAKSKGQMSFKFGSKRRTHHVS